MADTYSSKGFVLSLALFVALLALYAFLQSPLFTLRTIEVRGGDRLTPDDVMALADLTPGTNLFAIDLRETAEAILTHPVVADVRLGRRIPGALVVAVEERVPVAYLAAAGRLWLIDEEGVPLYTTEAPTEALPLITLDPPVSPTPGVSLDKPALRSALRFSGALTTKLLADLSEIHAGEEGLTAYTRDGITISLGKDGDMSRKARVLAGLMEQITRRDLAISHIDLRRAASPVFTEKR